MKRTSTCRRAIIRDGQIVGWEDFTPPKKMSTHQLAEKWARSEEGQEAYKVARLLRDADRDYHMVLVPAVNRRTGKPYWRRVDPEMYE